ncbi:MAG: threonine synthase [Acidobacteriota bacterium]
MSRSSVSAPADAQRFISTHGAAPATSFGLALRRGLAPDGGLYVPSRLPTMPSGVFDALPAALDAPDAVARTGRALFRHLLVDGGGDDDAHHLGPGLTPAVIDAALDAALDFPIPLVRLGEDDPGTWILELFHGPTYAFKDVAARVMARLLGAVAAAESDPRPLTILVATSGDTGGAVAQAFHGVAGTRVVVLYPRGRVTALQERQFATLGGNVLALAIDGSFDDCQALTKAVFADPALRDALRLSSANSINIGRLLPQAVYYLHAWAQLRAAGVDDAPVVVVPSGNFGNLTAGLIAQRLGTPIARFVAATNANDVVPAYLASGIYRPRPSQATASSAMDVGDPSNLARIRHLFDDDLDALRAALRGSAHDDDETTATIRDVHARTDYVLDPHTAVGVAALRALRADASADDALRRAPAIVLATAHPIKFPAVVAPAIGGDPPSPPGADALMRRTLRSEPLTGTLGALRARLLAWSDA